MAAVNPDWHKYVFASIAKHFKDGAAAASPALPLVVELLDHRDDAWEAADSKAEVLIMGPMTKELSKGLHRVRASVFVTLTSARTVSPAVHIGYEGVVSNLLDSCILVKNYPTNDTELTVLTPNPDQGDEIGPDREKPKDTDDQAFTTLQANYYGLLSEDT